MMSCSESGRRTFASYEGRPAWPAQNEWAVPAKTPHHKDLRRELVVWLAAEPALRAIRKSLFVSEQAVPQELEA